MNEKAKIVRAVSRIQSDIEFLEKLIEDFERDDKVESAYAVAFAVDDINTILRLFWELVENDH